MAKTKGRYIVPKAEQKDFDLMIQRANRRIQSAFKYIQQEELKSENAVRALVGDYNNSATWNTEKTVFSRSKRFSSERDYQQYKRHVEQWGGKENARSVDSIKQGYYKSIIKALTTVAIDNGAGDIMTKNGRLPGNIAKKVKNMTLEQMVNFFDHGDPSDEIEKNAFDSKDFIGVDRTEFVDITEGYINRLIELFPAKEKSISTPKRKRKGPPPKKRKRKAKK